MTTTTPSAALIPVAPVFTNTERLALAGFQAGYSGLTRQAYELDLRQYASWCHQHHLRLFQARRPDIECFARDLETRGRVRATITRRLCTIAGFYRYAVEEDLLDHSPAAHVRRPRLDYESHAIGLDRNELGALLVAAGLGAPAEHALISLLALNGLRVSEATGANIENLGVERGHRTLVITCKGGKVVTIPLAPRTARAIDLAVGERVDGPIFLSADGQRLDRYGAARIVRRVAVRAGITKPAGPHTLRHAFITAALDAGVPLRDVQEAASHADPRTTMPMTVPAAASTATPLTSSPPTSPERPGKELTAHTQTPPGRTAAARRNPGSRPACVTDRHPNSDHEPPICAVTCDSRRQLGVAQNRLICTRGTAVQRSFMHVSKSPRGLV
jgi:integrase/recombinase XerD